MRTIIIGGSFAGISCALAAKRLYGDQMEVLVFDQQATVGFIPSGLNLMLNEEIRKITEATFISDTAVRSAGVQLYLKHTVLAIDAAKQCVTVQANDGDTTQVFDYDRLVLAMGSKQTSTLVSPEASPHIISTKDLRSAEQALAVLEEAQFITVVGGGQIGLEASEALVNANKQVTLVEANETIANRYFDAEFVADIQQAIEMAGVDLRVNQPVQSITTEPLQVLLADDELAPDAVLLGVNLIPNSQLVSELVQLNEDRTIAVSPYLETSVPHIFAVGDLVQTPYAEDGTQFIALVNNAIRSGQIAAFNLMAPTVKQQHSLRVVGSRVFNQYIVSMGLTEREAQKVTKCHTVSVSADYTLTDDTPVYLKLVVDAVNGRILGAQMRSERNILSFADPLALALQQQLTDETLAFQDRLYYPRETAAYPIIYQAALESFTQRMAK